MIRKKGKSTIMLFVFLTFIISGVDTIGNEDDEDDATGSTFYDSTVEFLEPQDLEPNTRYEFVLLVTNAAVKGEEKTDWINRIDIFLPSMDYDIEAIYAPEPLHNDTGDETEIDRWVIWLNY